MKLRPGNQLIIANRLNVIQFIIAVDWEINPPETLSTIRQNISNEPERRHRQATSHRPTNGR